MAWCGYQYGAQAGYKGHQGNQRHTNGRSHYAGRSRPYEVCKCEKWVYLDRKKEFCTGCGCRFGDQPAPSTPTPTQGSLTPAQVEQAAALAAALGDRPECTFLVPLMAAAGISTRVAEAPPPAKPPSLNVQTKQSLARKKEAPDQAYRSEQKFIKKREHIDKLQLQMDKANEELKELHAEMEDKKKVAAEADENHQALEQSSPEPQDDEGDLQFLLTALPGGEDPRISSNPAVLALARTFSQGMASVRAKLEQEAAAESVVPTEEADTLMGDASKAAADVAAEAASRGTGTPASSVLPSPGVTAALSQATQAVAAAIASGPSSWSPASRPFCPKGPAVGPQYPL